MRVVIFAMAVLSATACTGKIFIQPGLVSMSEEQVTVQYRPVLTPGSAYPMLNTANGADIIEVANKACANFQKSPKHLGYSCGVNMPTSAGVVCVEYHYIYACE